jgi:hypothetical protein
MDPARLTFADNGFSLAVAVRRVSSQWRHTHAGLCYRDGGSLWLLHMAGDRSLEHEAFNAAYVCTIPRIPPLRLPFFMALCRAMRDRLPTLRYALRHPDNAIFLIQPGGDVVLTKGGAGLNCATFVLVFFQSYGFPLVNLSTWQLRPEDGAWHKNLVRFVNSTDPVQANLIRSEIGCARVRPEETAGACLEGNLPCEFAQCEANGQYILQVLDGFLTSAEHGEAIERAYYYALERGGGSLPSFDSFSADNDYFRAVGDVLRHRR